MSKHKVVVAMSGGVDSSVTAALLKEEGYEVVGITMQIWPKGGVERFGGCCGLEAIEDAKRVANRLGIPHYILDLREDFQKKVIANFCEEYQKGRTPNPCIRCNQYIKFDALLKKAKNVGADYIATGHYARIEYDEGEKKYLLKRGIDRKKDQSYVLYTMSRQQLKHTLMPLGNYTKEKVKQIARKLDLPVASRPESQEICFVPDDDYPNFLQKYLPEAAKPGPIVNKEGEVVGRHQGIIFYTIGQRRGIGIAAKEPLYVIAIDQESNSVIVGRREDGYSDELIAKDTNFIGTENANGRIRAEVKIRYSHKPAWATIIPLRKGKVKVKFDRPQWAITPGQAVVFYDGDTVLGGGTISAYRRST